MKQHFWLGNDEDYRLLPTANTRIESVILGKRDGIRRFAAYIETDCTEVLLAQSGRTRLFHRGRSLVLGEGQGALFLPGEVRGYSVEEGENASFLCLRLRGVRGKPPQRNAGPTAFSLGAAMTAAQLACGMLMESAQLAGRCAQEVARNALSTLLCLFNEAEALPGAREGGNSQAVSAAMAYIDENFALGPTMEQIAASCFLSASRLSSLMKRETGFSPFDYVIERRIGQAQQRLMYGAQSVSDVAREAGYPSLSSFSAAFSRRIGVSPEAFRKICGAYGGNASQNRQNITLE